MRKLFHAARSDESLMLAYQKGDSSAFEVLYARHKNGLFNFLFYNCRSSHMVEDFAHDTWMSIIRGIASYRPTATFKAYLYRIARNKVIDYWRREKNQDAEHVPYDETESNIALSESGSAERLTHLNELREVIMTLPLEQREAFLLREEGFTQSEIAEITDSKPETVKSRLRYAVQHLRSMIEVPS